MDDSSRNREDGSPPSRVLVVTGDHSLADPTKWEGRYTEEDLELHREMQAALESLPGYTFEFLAEHARLLEHLRHGPPPDLVLNLCDTGFNNVAAQELHVPALLELLGIPYTGAPPAGMVLCYDKAIVRLVADAHGVPVPREIFVSHEQPLDEAAFFPALIKPVHGDGSVGITRNAVVHDADEARDYLDWFGKTLPGRAALMQEYLPGPEYGLALIGNPATGFVVLPPLEVDFSGLPEGVAPILAFESKTGPDNPYSAVRIKPAQLAETTLAMLRRHASLLFERLQCRDYARFDFRTGTDGVIKLMEVNPNPAWSRAAKLALMASFGGKSYPELLRMILEAARARLSHGGRAR